MRTLSIFCLFIACMAACAPIQFSFTTFPPEDTTAATVTPKPSPTSAPEPISTLTTTTDVIAFDFVAELCKAKWLNGNQQLTACPAVNADHSGGYAVALDPLTEDFPANTPVLLTIPAWNGSSSLFLRYPKYTVHLNDRFRATLRCKQSSPCDVEFALEYYDSTGAHHILPPAWDYETGNVALLAETDLTALAGQTVEFMLVLRISHSLDNPQQDNGLWIAPQIYRPQQ